MFSWSGRHSSLSVSKLDSGASGASGLSYWASEPTLSPLASKEQPKQYLQYFHQNFRHLMFWMLDYKNVTRTNTVFGHVRYINIPTWLRRFRVKNEFFSSFICLSMSKRDLNTQKTPPNIEVCPESLRAMLEYWYIERGLLVFVLNGCSLALSESYI